MTSLVIRELAPGTALDRRAMTAVRGGGSSSYGGYGSIANITVSPNIVQNISQVQVVDVAALNNIGYIGAGFGPLNLKVNPSQYANTGVTF
ncbi:hypothetical protein E1N52_31215 [Paraburkholderia guartelaensis]|jgi:hypothetical protein|uniref:Uncharacterized protein n=1 Tax=Paraburkholderia guartelaensis TaxID=2546446 RepID=A0A4R5L808_9BURK|nr:hypothetical protein [Paraburkholderia guartelaensis]TDG04162.1 hypothetical protein E1N52_31215 [Paraburkholderia guartelaensis]